MKSGAGVGRYRPQLDGLRTFCIIFTIFNHTPGRPVWINGTVGVDVFFALSGWLITWLLLQELSVKGSVKLASFYVRRVFRIVPLYLLTVGLYIALSAGNLKAGARSELAHSLPFMLSFNMEYRPEAAGNLFGQAWTLGIEEKFYLLWPLLLYLLPGRKRLLAWITASLLSMALIVLSGFSPLVLRGYLGLGFGASAALLVTHRPRLREWLGLTPVAGLLLIFMLVPYTLSIMYPEPLIWNVAISFFGAGLVASLWLQGDQIVSRFLSLRPLPWLGALTYAIYLVQSIAIRAAESLTSRVRLPNQGWVLFGLSYLLCVAAAYGLHRLVELPFITRGKALARAL